MDWRATFRFVDNNGARAHMSVNLPETMTVAAAISYVQALGAAAQAVSSASLVSAKISSTIDIPDAPPPHILSDVYTRLIVIFRNGYEPYSVNLPSPGNLPFDTVGSLRATRLGVDKFLLPPMQAFVQRMSEDTVTAWGDAFNADNCVGGITRGRE